MNPLQDRGFTYPGRRNLGLEANKAIIGAHVAALFNQHRVAQTDEFFTQDYLDHASLPGQAPGLEAPTSGAAT
jgi:hypothetical protein